MAKADYLFTANNVYLNLKDYEQNYEKKCVVVSYVKCHLLQYESLEDFSIYGINVYVEENSKGYRIRFDDNTLDIVLNEYEIIDYTFH